MSIEQNQAGSYYVLKTWIIAFMIFEFLGFVPILGICGLLSIRLIGEDFWPVAAIIWVVVYLFTTLRLRSLRCPRCGKNYFGNLLALFGGYVALRHRDSLFSKECANCGLRIGSN